MPRDFELQRRAFDRLPEVNIDGVLEIRPLFRRFLGFSAAFEKLAEDVLETAPLFGARLLFGPSGILLEVLAEIESVEIHIGRSLRTSAIRPGTTARRRHTTLAVVTDLVVHLALLLVAQDVVSFPEHP